MSGTDGKIITKECDHSWELIKDEDGSGRDCSYYQCRLCDAALYPEDMTSTNQP